MVKGRTRRLPTLREFENWLMRDAKLSRAEARLTAAKGYARLLRERQAAPGAPPNLARRIREVTRMINRRGKSL